MYRNLYQRRFDDIFIFLEVYYNQLKTSFDESIESRTLNNILYDPSASASEKQSQRVQGLTEPLHAELIAQLLDNLESEEPAEELAFVINNNKGAKPGYHSGAKDSKVPLACFSRAIEVVCKRDNCTFSHDPSVLSAYLQDTLQKILKGLNYKKSATQSTSILQRPPQKHNFVSQSDQLDLSASDGLTLPNLNFSAEAVLAEVMRQNFLHHYPEVNNMSAMHREGSIVLPGAHIHTKPIPSSGALHASYILSKLVDHYR